MCLFGVADGNIFTQCRVEDVGEEPGEVTFPSKVFKLIYSEVKIMVLLVWSVY